MLQLKIRTSNGGVTLCLDEKNYTYITAPRYT